MLLTVTGLQIPVIPSKDEVGNVGAAAPIHIAGNAANAGIVSAFITCTKIACVAHNPVTGVKVYVPVTVLLTVAGLHVPVIPLVDVVSNAGAIPPVHIAGNGANVGGIVDGFIA